MTEKTLLAEKENMHKDLKERKRRKKHLVEKLGKRSTLLTDVDYACTESITRTFVCKSMYTFFERRLGER